MFLIIVILCVLLCFASACISVFLAFVFLFADWGHSENTALAVGLGFAILAQCFLWLAKSMMEEE